MNINPTLKNSYKESGRIIREASKNNQLVLFVGAGVSLNSGMPSWTDAVAEIQKHLGDVKESDTLKIPQYYFNERGKKEYTALMRKIFKYGEPLQTTRVHKKIMQFNASTIITTNYDHLLEQASEENAEVRQVISCDADLPYRTVNKELIKMHGDFEHDNFVLKEDDYLTYSSNFKLIENYVKSIIGSKIVLFIGYSFSDPDIKQIFSWIKEILKSDFQRAYLINITDDYDKNKSEYYKNLGVNVIYARTWLNISDNDKTGLEDILIGTLDKILSPAKLSPIDSIYEKLKGFYGLNYVYKKYIIDAFKRYYIIFNADNFLVPVGDESSKNNANKLLSDIFIDPKDKKVDNHIKKLRSIIKHSSVQGFVINDNKNDLNKENSTCHWTDAVLNFDFEKLREIKAKNDILLNDNQPELYLIQASISYYLKDYLISYNYLRRASRYLYVQRKYAYYFISEFSRKYLGNLILGSSNLKNSLRKDLSEFKDEVNSINLERTLNSLPDLGNNNKFLKEILDLSFFYSLFQKIYSKSLQTEEEANTKYALYAGIPAYQQLQRDMLDFFNYGLKNGLLFDKSFQIVEIYEMYIRSKLLSVASKDKEDEFLAGIPMSEHNIHSDSLDKFDLYVVMTYIHDAQSIEKIFNNYSVEYIKVNDEGLQYLSTIALNIVKTKKNNSINELYWKFVALCGHVRLTQRAVDVVLKSLRVKMKYFDFLENQNIIIDFINNARHQQLLTKKIADLKALLDTALKKIKIRRESDFEHLIIVLGFSIKELKHFYDNDSIIKDLMNAKLDKPIIDLYSVCTSEIKNKIRSFFKKEKFDKIPKNMDKYRDLTVHGIIAPKKDVENKVIDFLEGKTKFEGNTKSNPKDIANQLAMLYLNDKILDKKDVKDAINTYATEEDKWLIDPFNFDYDKFDINWISHCNQPLLKQLSSKASSQISQQFKKSYQRGKLDDNLLDIYFTYFA